LSSFQPLRDFVKQAGYMIAVGDPRGRRFLLCVAAFFRHVPKDGG
jgi:hypothetical protein